MLSARDLAPAMDYDNDFSFAYKKHKAKFTTAKCPAITNCKLQIQDKMLVSSSDTRSNRGYNTN